MNVAIPRTGRRKGTAVASSWASFGGSVLCSPTQTIFVPSAVSEALCIGRPRPGIKTAASI